MKGLILCGGTGTRLGDLTKVCNKHILPVYDRPMVYYPLATLVNAGITDIALVVSDQTAYQFISLLKDGKHLGLTSLSYLFQAQNNGIAGALGLAESFAGKEKLAVILGDNTSDIDFSHHIKAFQHYFAGTQIFLKEVSDPERFGCPEFNEKQEITQIIEKPANPSSNFAAIGLYLFDDLVFEYVRNCRPSERGELEITDILNQYVQAQSLTYRVINGFWMDAGNPESLYLANQYWREKHHDRSKASQTS